MKKETLLMATVALASIATATALLGFAGQALPFGLLSIVTYLVAIQTKV